MTINERLARGEIVEAGGRLYRKCPDCEQVVCLNKRFFGSMHLCLTEDELAQKRAMQQRRPR